MKNLEQWMQELTTDMLEVDSFSRQIAETIGIENYLRLTEVCGGNTIYIPKIDSLVKPLRDRKLREDFNGYNYMELSRKYNISERWIRELCGDGYPAGQMNIMEFIGEE